MKLHRIWAPHFLSVAAYDRTADCKKREWAFFPQFIFFFSKFIVFSFFSTSGMEVDAVRGSPSPPFVGERRRRPRLTRARRSREIAAAVRGQRKPTAARGQRNMPCLLPQSTLQCPPVLAPRKRYAVPVHVYIFTLTHTTKKLFFIW